MEGILIPAYITGVNALKDKSVKIVIVTQELTPEKAGELFGINGQLVTTYISAKGLTPADKDLIDQLEPDMPGKSPSQRLRNVLYLLWQKSNEGFKDKNLHYIHYMEKIIEEYKSKL